MFANYPMYARIIRKCIHRVGKNFPDKRNSWQNTSDISFENMILKALVTLDNYETTIKQQKMLENIINWACMEWTNLENRKIYNDAQ